MNTIHEEIKVLEKELIETRRYFHSHPETGWFTFFTTAVIIDKLKRLGYDLKLADEIVSPKHQLGLGNQEQLNLAIKRAKDLLDEDLHYLVDKMGNGLTGVVAIIDTKIEGPTTAFRFDIDGVDVTESKDKAHLPFKEGFVSDIEGITHACGHDGHITIGLGLAKLISQNRDKFKGKFIFIFQSGEEGCRGAVGMEPTGFLNDVDYLIGAHIGFQAKENKGFICGINKFLSTSKFDVYFTGTSAHAAGAPQEGCNALLAASQAAIQMHAITRHADGITRINVGVLKAGEGRNVIAPNAFMACETRGETTELNDFMKQKCIDILDGVSKIHSVSYELIETGGTAGGDSSKEITKLFKEAALESPYIENNSIIDEYDFGACEDFAHFMRTVQKNGGQSGYAMIGTKLAAGHHNNSFDFDESALSSGLDIFYRLAFKLNKK